VLTIFANWWWAFVLAGFVFCFWSALRAGALYDAGTELLFDMELRENEEAAKKAVSAQ
jgi:hypothetical protein